MVDSIAENKATGELTSHKNGRKKVELEFNESVVINKYIETVSNLKKAS